MGIAYFSSHGSPSGLADLVSSSDMDDWPSREPQVAQTHKRHGIWTMPSGPRTLEKCTIHNYRDAPRYHSLPSGGGESRCIAFHLGCCTAAENTGAWMRGLSMWMCSNCSLLCNPTTSTRFEKQPPVTHTGLPLLPEPRRCLCEEQYGWFPDIRNVCSRCLFYACPLLSTVVATGWTLVAPYWPVLEVFFSTPLPTSETRLPHCSYSHYSTGAARSAVPNIGHILTWPLNPEGQTTASSVKTFSLGSERKWECPQNPRTPCTSRN